MHKYYSTVEFMPRRYTDHLLLQARHRDLVEGWAREAAAFLADTDKFLRESALLQARDGIHKYNGLKPGVCLS